MNKELIIERYKNPHNWSEELYGNKGNSINHSCGDEIYLSLEIKDRKVISGKYNGNGCSICLASADILIDKIKGKEIKDILTLKESDILENIGMTEESSRKRCATLSLEAVFNAINGVE